MKKTVIKILGCMVLLHLFSLPVLAQEQIGSISIEGNRYISIQKIERVLRLKSGDPYDEELLRAAVKRLFATKEFSDIECYREDSAEEGLKIIIVVREYQKIDEVAYEGNKHVDEDDLDPEISMKDGAFARPAYIRNDHETIADIYREKGYYRVAVTDTMVLDQKTGKKKLLYVIQEGNKVSIKHIDFFGNKALDSDNIKKVMDSKEDRWWRADFKPKGLEEDETKIVSLYREHGFLDAEVKDRELIFSEDGKDLDIFITLAEEKLYHVGKITWQGNKIFPDTSITNRIAFDRGDVFNDLQFQNVQIGINSLYWDRGYIFSSISPQKDVRGDTIDVDFEIVEGQPAHVNELNITGNTKTHEEVIRRQLVIVPGEVFIRPRLIRSLREIFNLGFFAGPPEVNTSEPNNEGDIDLSLQVQEKSAGQFRFGAGFSALNKVSGFLGVEEPNLFGKGQRIGLNWEFSSYRQNMDVRFTEPWLFGTPTELTLNVFNMVQNRISQQYYNDRRRGFSVRVGRPFPWFDYTSVFGQYKYQEVELTNFNEGYQGALLDIDWPQRTSSITVTLMRNSTDNPFHPTTGTSSFLTADWNGGDLLGGDVRFQRYEARFAWYQKLLWKFVLETRYRIGVVDGYDSPSQVPDYERFRLGGNRVYGLRGYDFYEVVPEGNQEYIGGRFMESLSYEISFPIAPTIYGLFFLDNGNTWNNFRGADLFDLKKGLGLGIRLELPMLGTVGFDYGYGLDKVGGASWEPHITLGGMF